MTETGGRLAASAASTPAAAGSIYDLGYRHYDGPRLGRRHAARALFLHSLRGAYGIGRGGRAKIAPILLVGLAIIPAIVGVGIMALARQVGGGEFLADASPIRHDTYFSLITTLVMLFCAAQAPEILGRDQRHGLLSLYFSRALRRVDYALGRLAGIVIAILIFVLLPQSIIFVGSILSAADTGKQLGTEIGLLPAILGQAAIISLLLGSVATVVSAFTPRRVYATTSIIAVLFVTSLITSVLAERGSLVIARLLVLLSPNDVLDATNAFLFGRAGDEAATELAQLPGPVYVVAAAAITVACIALLVRRFERIPA